MAVKQSVKRKSTTATKGKKTGASTSAPKKGQKRKGKARKHHWLRWLVFLLILVVAIILGAFSWDRWFRYDDNQDIQGEWKASGQTAVVVVDDKQLHLTDEVAYDYTLNTWDKTIEFSFGKLLNSGTYQFSEDRKTLVIVEGGTTDLVGDFVKNLGVSAESLDASNAPTTVFIKLSSKTDTEPQVMVQEPAPDSGAASTGDTATDGSSSGGNEGAEDIEGDTGSLFDTITDRTGPA